MNRESIDRLLERWLAALQNVDGFDELLTDDVLDRTTSTRGRDAFKERARAVRAKLGDFTVRVDDVIVDGDAVAWRWTLTATSGTALRGANFQRLDGDRVAEHWTLAGP